MKKALITITMSLLLALLLASTTFAAPAGTKKAVPFKGSLQAVETYALNFPSLSVDATGIGQATLTETPNIDQIVEAYTVTGGTGRFAGASGTFTVERLVNLATGVTSGTIDGDIVIP